MDGTFGDKEVEAQVTRLLQGDEAQRSEAFRLIDRHFRDGLCGAARRVNDRIDVANLWGNALAWFWSHSQGLDYDNCRSPIPLIYTFMVRRAIDLGRRINLDDRAVDALRHRLRGRQAGDWWRRLSPSEREEVDRQMVTFIERLPPQQRLVWRIYKRQFPATASMAKLRELVAEHTGKPVTLASVERALQEGRKKIRAMFAEKGFA